MDPDLRLYCLTAVRLGASRALSWSLWTVERPETSLSDFKTAWGHARASVALSKSYPGLANGNAG